MGLFDKIKEPIFSKDTSSAKEQLEQLKQLQVSASPQLKAQIEQDIKMLTAGIYGEDNIAFELKNSHIPMIILQDLYVEDGELSAQIDYLIITRKRNFVIECKNLIGDIEINSNGDFIRTLNFKDKYKKEGIYSPITQNTRHLELLKQLRCKSKSNIIIKALFTKFFYENYRGVVVLANPKTVLNVKYAKKEVKEQVIRADQLIEYIKKVNNEHGAENVQEKDMEQRAQYFLELHKENQVNYLEKYQNENFHQQPSVPSAIPHKEDASRTTKQVEERNTCLYTESDVFMELKAYRLKKSREENVKPYFLYNDKQLIDLMDKNPRSIDELKSVSGFGEVKCNKYGEDILNILQNK